MRTRSSATRWTRPDCGAWSRSQRRSPAGARRPRGKGAAWVSPLTAVSSPMLRRSLKSKSTARDRCTFRMCGLRSMRGQSSAPTMAGTSNLPRVERGLTPSPPRFYGTLIKVTMSQLLTLLLLLTGVFASAQEIVVAAAADLNAALPQIVESYSKRTGQTVKLSFGSSGNLTNQIRNGAPFDVFLSTDQDYPRQLIAEGLASKDTLYRYAVGRLVLWVPRDSPGDVAKLGMQALLDPSVKKISIANPATAPY